MIRKLSNKGINSNRKNSGVGYVILPRDLDRESYIKTCYRTGTVTLFIEDGFDITNRVRIGKIAIQLIEFPNKVGELGSPVVWVNYPGQEEPIITEVLFNQQEGLDIQEGSFLLKKEKSGSDSQVFMSRDGKMMISVRSDYDETFIDIRSLGKDNTGAVNISSNGTVNVISDNEVNVVSKLIKHNDGTEPMVLGDTLAEFLTNFVDQVGAITVATSIGAQPIINKVQVLELKNSIEAIKSQISKLD